MRPVIGKMVAALEPCVAAGRADWLAARSEILVASSELVRVEMFRAYRRNNPAVLPEAPALAAGLDLIPLSGAVLDQAANAELSTFIAYDRRLADAATAPGLDLIAPGT
jgi:uncharacterized protein